MASHGGKREGSGRRKGSPTEKTTKIAREFIQSEAMTPLEVMLRCMSNHVDRGEFELAFPYAVASAPYIHAKLGNTQGQTKIQPIIHIVDEFPQHRESESPPSISLEYSFQDSH